MIFNIIVNNQHLNVLNVKNYIIYKIINVMNKKLFKIVIFMINIKINVLNVLINTFYNHKIVINIQME